MVKRLTILYLILAAAFVAAVVLPVWLIPHSAIEDNIERSRRSLQYRAQPFDNRFYRYDYFTDRLMIEIADHADDEHPLDAAMSSLYVALPGAIETGGEVVVGNEDGRPVITYGRYWQGYQALLRPLLAVMDYDAIIRLNAIIGFALMVCVAMALWRRLGPAWAIVTVATLARAGYPVMLRSMQFMACPTIAMGAMILIAYRPRLARGPNLVLTMFTLGALTAFFDFLTNPLLTLCYPLMVGIAINQGCDGKPLRRVIDGTAGWLVGYALLWASKLLLAWLVTGLPLLQNGLKAATFRIGGSVGDSEPLISWALHWHSWGEWGALAGVLLIYQLLFCKGWEAIKANLWLLIVALMPIVWVAVLYNHSVLHFSYVWRTLVPSACALLMFMLTTTSLKKIKIWSRKS